MDLIVDKDIPQLSNLSLSKEIRKVIDVFVANSESCKKKSV